MTALLSTALSAAKYEKLQKEKEELERRFEGELKKLGWQQREELQVLEERLQLQYSAEIERLQEEHQAQIVRLKTQHQEQVSHKTVNALNHSGYDRDQALPHLEP